MRLSDTVEDAADIRNRGKISKEGYQVSEFGVVRVVEP